MIERSGDKSYSELAGSGLAGRILGRMGPRKRVFVAFSLTWLPLLILSAAQGLAWNRDLRIPFLYDFENHIRFLLVVPLFTVTDLILIPRVREIFDEFAENDFIDESQRQRFRSNIRFLQRLNSSILADIILIILIVAAALGGLQRAASLHPQSWQIMPSSEAISVSAAGWYLIYIAVPIWQFLVFRWLWHVLVYSIFLLRTARLDLKLTPTHPDLAAGLQFLSLAQVWLAPFVFALSAVYSASIGIKIVFEGANIWQFKLEISLFVIIACLFVIAPLLVFTPKLMYTRRIGLLRYADLASRYVQSFDRKWLKSVHEPPEELLGTSDIQSLADMANSFNIIRSMRPVPFDRNFVFSVIVSVVIPLVPLFFSIYSIKDLARVVRSILF